MKKLIESFKKLNAERVEIVQKMSDNFDKLWNAYGEALLDNWLLGYIAIILTIIIIYLVIHNFRTIRYWKRRNQGLRNAIRADVREYRNCL